MRVTIVCHDFDGVSNTFIRAHAKQLPAICKGCDVQTVVGGIPRKNGSSFGRAIAGSLPQFPYSIAASLKQSVITAAYRACFIETKPDVVLAEFGPTAALALPACRSLGIPLVAHFHGYDVSRHRTLRAYRSRYRDLFAYASAVIGVSSDMCARLIELGANSDLTYHVTYGVDSNVFSTPSDRQSRISNRFLCVGRLTEKKSPLTVIRAFADVRRRLNDRNEPTLLMIGDGPLMSDCRRLVDALNLHSCVELYGASDHSYVQTQMLQCGMFVQHSVTAPDGDREGTPNTILEAAACGMPIIATKHAGIPDVLTDGVHALLVDENEVQQTADAMYRLATDTYLAQQIGDAASQHVRSNYSVDRSISRLHDILVDAMSKRNKLSKTTAKP